MPTKVTSTTSTNTNPALRTAQAGPVAKHTLLKLGSYGKEVAQLQRLLKERGFLSEKATGQFDAATLEAVKKYQAAKGLQVDGAVGQQTWGSFNGETLAPGVDLLKKGSGHAGNSGFDPTTDTPMPPISATPTQGASSDQATTMLDTARQYLGLHETGVNGNPFSKALGRPAEAWCADFVSFLAHKAGLKLNTASAQGVQDYLTAHGTWKGKHNPAPGDAVTFDWAGRNGHADHVGIVERVYQRNGQLYVDTIEGNASDAVRRRTYPINDPAIKGFGTIV